MSKEDKLASAELNYESALLARLEKESRRISEGRKMPRQSKWLPDVSRETVLRVVEKLSGKDPQACKNS